MVVHGCENSFDYYGQNRETSFDLILSRWMYVSDSIYKPSSLTLDTMQQNITITLWIHPQHFFFWQHKVEIQCS